LIPDWRHAGLTNLCWTDHAWLTEPNSRGRTDKD
jgi:hypothetical protein